MNSKNAVHTQLFFEFKQFSKNDMRLSGQALHYNSINKRSLFKIYGCIHSYYRGCCSNAAALSWAGRDEPTPFGRRLLQSQVPPCANGIFGRYPRSWFFQMEENFSFGGSFFWHCGGSVSDWRAGSLLPSGKSKYGALLA